MGISHSVQRTRITARLDSSTQELLTQAAALSGVSSINSFVLNAAIEKAKALIEQELILKLTQRDAALLLAALDQPGKVIPALQSAAQRYNNVQ
jgi:uncharacterized protein (DUF1778 family)